MKFVVSSTSLLKQLNAIGGAIATNPLVPILENFLFDIDKEKLVITASDLQTSMICEMAIESKEIGAICVPAKLLIETLKNLPDQPVSFTVDEITYSIELSSDNGRYKLSGESAADFPRIPEVSKNHSIAIGSDIVSRAITNTIFATSLDELRPAMMGIFVQFTANNTTFVSTDGHRLVRYRRVDALSNNEESSIIIPRKALELLKKSLPNDNASIKLEFNSSNAFFSFNSVRMICRLIDERYPDYENAIPLENPNVLKIDRLELLASLKRIEIYSNKATSQVRLKIAGSELHISSEDTNFSNEANERLSCDYEGNDMEIGFNAKFLIQMLGNMDCRNIRLNMSTPNKAGILTPDDETKNEELMMLVMPVMLNN